MRAVQRLFYGPIVRGISSAVGSIYVGPATFELRNGAYMVLCLGIMPYLMMLIIGRGKPADLGLRLPNKIGIRLIFVSVLLSLPFVVWMTQSEHFTPYYKPHIERAGHAVFISYNILNMFTEHFLFHGVVLALARQGLRWPSVAEVHISTTSGRKRNLQWFGLAQPTKGAKGLLAATRWLGMPDGCLIAVFVSALHFSLVHLSKDPRELILSFPGGVILAFIAYRTNSFLVPLIIHLATAGLAYALMIAGP